MATIILCDRCEEKINTSHLVIRTLDSADLQDMRGTERDLCDRCAKAFVNWMKTPPPKAME